MVQNNRQHVLYATDKRVFIFELNGAMADLQTRFMMDHIHKEVVEEIKGSPLELQESRDYLLKHGQFSDVFFKISQQQFDLLLNIFNACLTNETRHDVEVGVDQMLDAKKLGKMVRCEEAQKLLMCYERLNCDVTATISHEVTMSNFCIIWESRDSIAINFDCSEKIKSDSDAAQSLLGRLNEKFVGIATLGGITSTPYATQVKVVSKLSLDEVRQFAMPCKDLSGN